MAFKDILVHVEVDSTCPARLETAVNLAVAHGAHLVGLHVRPPLHLPGAISPDFGGEIARLHGLYTNEAAARAKQSFERAVGLAGLSSEWREVRGDLIESVAVHARYCDLAVVGQSDTAIDGERRLADHLPLASGTPVLIVPCVGRYPTVGERVLLGWDASREAKRAMSDALPILSQAKRVVVLAVNPQEGKTAHGEVPCADIALHLARHGVRAECSAIPAQDLEVGSVLLSRAADEGSDLIVIGAYGHSRLKELILGGTTRHLLAHMTVPVLMSH